MIRIIEIGTPEAVEQMKKEAVEQMKKEAVERNKTPRDKLVDDINASATTGDEKLETWQHHAAKMQEIGYTKVKHFTFELFGKKCPKNMTATKQKVIAGAVTECLEKFAEKHYFEGDNLNRTMLRIGGIHLLAKMVGREGFVSFSFAPILEKYGVVVPEWLQVKLTPSPKREERRERSRGERQSRGAVEMLKTFSGARVPVTRVKDDGTVVEITKARKEIPVLSAVEVEANRRANIAARATRARVPKAKPQKEEKKVDKKKQGGGKQH